MGLTEAIPYAYAGKRYDAKTNLVYFGQRYYDPELSRWLTVDPLGPVDHSNLYQYVFNNPFAYRDPSGEFVMAIPLLVWGAQLALPTLTAVAYTALTGVVAYAGYKSVQYMNERGYDNVFFDRYRTSTWKNTNPFDGPIDEDIVVVDEKGNAIKVPQGNWLAGSRDGKWIQEMKPGLGPKGEPTGQRKDGGGHPPPKHKDVRSNKPHAHVPGVLNPDGTDWLPLKN